MKTMEDGDIFNFVIGGTAYIVATWWQRPWIPIAMKALSPKVYVSFGTPDVAFYSESKITLRKIVYHLNVNVMKYHLLSKDIHFQLCIHQSFILIFLNIKLTAFYLRMESGKFLYIREEGFS